MQIQDVVLYLHILQIIRKHFWPTYVFLCLKVLNGLLNNRKCFCKKIITKYKGIWSNTIIMRDYACTPFTLLSQQVNTPMLLCSFELYYGKIHIQSLHINIPVFFGIFNFDICNLSSRLSYMLIKTNKQNTFLIFLKGHY